MRAEEPPEQALASLNRLFVTALLALAQAGRAEEACRLAAKGWSALRDHNPREAERLNAALHGLTRSSARVSLKETGDVHG